MLLRPSELPSGWTPVGQADYKASELPTQFCLAAYPGYVAGSSVNYSLNLDPKTNYEQGHLVVDIKMTNSEADAQKQLEMLRSADSLTSAARRCFLDGYKTLIGDAAGAENLLPGAELLARATPKVALEGLTMRASVPYRFLNSNKMMYIDDIRIQTGRIVARLRFMTCCNPFDYDTVEDPAVEAVAKRMLSASPNLAD